MSFWVFLSQQLALKDSPLIYIFVGVALQIVRNGNSSNFAISWFYVLLLIHVPLQL